MRQNDAARQIRDRLTADQVARHYGFEPNRAGFIRCPFHSGDHSASLKLYGEDRGFHCFGCGKHGSVIDFVMELYGLDFKQACVRLNEDFNLGVIQGRRDRKSRLEASRRATEALRERERKEWEEKQTEAEENALAAEHRYWWEVSRVFAPGPDGYIHPMYETAVKALPYLEYLLDDYADRRWSTLAT